ncbi:MAG: hypothetical protein KTR33_13960 [Gammaproteobacteria bacterium]|nr:hypothetical protein [Gammaproteobacteria bacterium]
MEFYSRKLLHVFYSAFVAMLILSVPATASSTDAPRVGVLSLSAGLASSISDLEFGSVQVGKAIPRRFILTHTGLDGSADITLYSTWMDETDALSFTSDFDGPQTLSAGESVALEVTFRPQVAGEYTGTLMISHNGDSGLEIFTLSGQAVAPDSPADYTTKLTSTPEPFDEGILDRATGAKIGFGKSTLSGIGTIKPTSLQFGPDGKLYVADMLGLIKIYTVKRTGKNKYKVTDTETLTEIKNIPNHNDNGALNKSIKNRLVTGLLVVGTPNDPILYVNSSDPRIGGGPSHKDTNLDTNSSMLSRLTRSGKGWTRKDLVRGLPRSEENHHVNGMALNEDTNMLYVAAGGNTNQGAPSQNFARSPEYALSAAILEIDLGQIGNTTYDLPTLDDQTRAGVKDANDPFGGNNGLNQAKLVPGGPVQVYAPGFRNAYDVVLTQQGKMYTVDNGPNAGWGNIPVKEGKAGNCTNALKEPGVTYQDSLHHITGRGYYGGHANPTRGNKKNTFNSKNPQSPVSTSNPVECDYRIPGSQSKALTLFGASTNGLVEYTASNFAGAMQGDLLAAAFNNKIYRMSLKNNGTALQSKSTLFTNVGKTPLDVTAQGDDDIFPGTVWVADFSQKKIVAFEPTDYSSTGDTVVVPVCTGSPANVDSDGDNYTNGDEIANGTDPCSAADVPTDADDDGLSDLADADDDNDGIDDVDDAFALNSNNGSGNVIPLFYHWENNSSNPGYLFNLGFTGLMINGSQSYIDAFDPEKLTAGGAAGVFTIDEVDSGTALNGKNTQKYAFQFGLDVDSSTPVFTASTRILAPFSGVTPDSRQQMGFFLGTGDQDNYVQLVVNGANEQGGIKFGLEKDGKYNSVNYLPVSVIGAESVDLYLTVDPASGEVSAHYRVNFAGHDAILKTVEGTTVMPASWLDGKKALALGIISTRGSAPTFTATWDHLDATLGRVMDGETDSSDDSEESADDDQPTDNNATATAVVDGVVTLEAEAWSQVVTTSTHQWKSISRTGASGTAVITTPDSGALKKSIAGSPMLSYLVNFDAAGKYQVWLRGSGDTNAKGEGKSDSAYVGLNGSAATALAIQDFPASWRWSNDLRGGGKAMLTVPSAGVHAVNLWMREDGLAVDQIVLSRKDGYDPASQSTDDSEADDNDSNENNDASDNADSDGNSGETADDNEDTGTGGSTGGDSSDSVSSEAAVVVEAEAYSSSTKTSSHSWVVTSATGASDGKAMVTTPDNGSLKKTSSGSPVLSYALQFPAAGKYFVWVRGSGDTNSKGEGRSDSLHVGLNGKLSTAGAIQNFPTAWTWSNQRRAGGAAYIVVPSKGQHIVNVWMREDGLIVDKLVLTPVASDQPQGIGPEASASGSQTDSEETGSGSAGQDDADSDSTGGDEDSDTDVDEESSGNTGDSAVEPTAAGLIEIEAEQFTERANSKSHQWVSASRSGATAGGSMITTPDSGALVRSVSAAPRLGYQVNFPAAGKYRVWVRGWGDSKNGEGKSDSVYVGLDNSASTAVPIENFPAGWNWSNTKRKGGAAEIVVPAKGIRTVTLWMREDGLTIDRLVLTQSTQYQPDGQAQEGDTASDDDQEQEDQEQDDGNSGADDNSGSAGSLSVSASTAWKKHNASGSVVARHEAAGVVFDNKLYVMGGRGNRPVSVFDPVKNSWTTKSKAPVQMDHFQPVVYGNKIYVIGAFQCCFPDEAPIANIYTYTPATDKWAKAGTIPKSRRRGSAGAVIYNDQIYIVGGNPNGHLKGAVKWFDRYDPATGKWTQLPSAPTARDHIQVSVANGKLVVAAGRQSAYPDTWGNMQAAVDVYDFATGKWTGGDSIPTKRAGAVAATVGSEVLIIGGESDNVRLARKQVEAFNVNSGRWRSLQSLAVGRHGGAAGILGNKLHVVTGNTTIGGGDETTSHETLTLQ